MHCKLGSLVLCAAALGCMPSAQAWNKAGHMTSAAIAYDDLKARSPSTVARIVAALKLHPQYDQRWRADVEAAGLSEDDANRRLFMLAARWPDDVRGDHDFDRPEDHFIDLAYKPPGQPSSVKVTQPGPENLVTAYAEHVSTLLNSTDEGDRAVALCWLFHLTGDVHQPLHSVSLFTTQYPTVEGDRGGTRFYIRVTPDSSTISLHAFWDNLILGSERYQVVANRATGLRNRAGLSRADLPELAERPFSPNAAMSWARDESLVVAKSVVYLNGKLKGSSSKSNGKSLPDDYVGKAQDAAERRMVLAGYRLSDAMATLLP
ncbi:S1/P1 nuclease [Roseateles sp.]|uniref:S1/P1 nuclease n=1 Tax=Roseateles sp. TaxID=1971397 RepID=UPI0025E9879B|nr:S1/P1 nuclease [Roseateles sp.]MBV8036114.1 S1/P1 nuclease [Roseateles sp.]